MSCEIKQKIFNTRYTYFLFERSSVIRPFGVWHAYSESCAPKLQILNGSASGRTTLVLWTEGHCLLLSPGFIKLKKIQSGFLPSEPSLKIYLLQAGIFIIPSISLNPVIRRP
jgi:hypothetical protein